MIAIVTDSTCDLPQDLVQQGNVEVIPAYINIGGESLRDEIDISRRAVYEQLDKLTALPTTSAPAPGEYIERYQKLLKHATHIISLHAASTLSGIYNAARLAAEMVAPERIRVIDTGQLSMGLGWTVHTAAKQAHSGASLEGVLNSIQDTLGRVRVYALLNTLEYLARSGRVNLVQLGLSNLLNLKPLVELRGGNVVSLGRIRTWKRASAALIDQLSSLGPIEKLAVLHTNYTDYAADFKDRLVDMLKPDEAFIVDVTTIIGVHVGPQAIGVAVVLRS